MPLPSTYSEMPSTLVSWRGAATGGWAGARTAGSVGSLDAGVGGVAVPGAALAEASDPATRPRTKAIEARGFTAVFITWTLVPARAGTWRLLSWSIRRSGCDKLRHHGADGAGVC